ncbi:hypothetical protein MKK67_00450 [Methylobacterium sp. J-072]|uniref:hypothetical protein n=1 Tax=Methylobacterium sp. J-072 TaxID=2836651 RepID=UPI001FBBFEB5|nr:hypothetical protein [Methylobacterium sp. J-072]MCJ2090985.1 hypothetical protein [Methylobacterium sp. J-072]
MIPDTLEIPDYLRSRLERLAAERDQEAGAFASQLLVVAVQMMEQQDGDELRAMLERGPFDVPASDGTANAARSALCILDAAGDMAREAVGRFLDGDVINHPRIRPSMILPLLNGVSDLNLARRDGDAENAAAVTRRLLDIWNGTA